MLCRLYVEDQDLEGRMEFELILQMDKVFVLILG